ncbi:SIS domain-containing protein [Pseudoalteromonas tunicata]|uniref:Putative phosphoheptose isomerase family protein n=1 Tax=Pseudoalteromonas tunicata D2 TaxID=87626 RepID=A4C7D2_9GAMM|nr:SIS domain-containing protein [Pseudoalteromonas tunicata]ATC95856.1 D-sedoheptulose 7-phosphate isomerase [Pseudoalteromonas tunicata]AXT31401.1 SIS domain-containing protein [Pseudoalteromonas tunicata]EAR29886.1 putative phosphoheptose isomerase family protein [Pseudoalteromonas tunicata D2]MDP4982181.1 SIS domain-containing protein [Pseudoalteromonas tunicata]MDP5214340.1 SIS domain-containing protein [Pseudoalteromonas tunicata]
MNSTTTAQSYLASLARHRAAFDTLENHQTQALALLEQCLITLKQGGKVVWFGNGGSAADAQHLAAEFVVRYKKERGPLASIALTTDTSILTAHSNDYTFDTVFERQVQALCKPQDLVIGLTTSGTSKNINLALEAANEIGAYTVALTGRDGGLVKDIAKLAIIIANDETARIQEAHMFLGHWLCEALDLTWTESL